MRRAMVDIERDIMRPNADKIRMIMQVHDEIIFECDENVATDFATRIEAAMENVAKLSVPLAADYTIGKFWGK